MKPAHVECALEVRLMDNPAHAQAVIEVVQAGECRAWPVPLLAIANDE